MERRSKPRSRGDAGKFAATEIRPEKVARGREVAAALRAGGSPGPMSDRAFERIVDDLRDPVELKEWEIETASKARRDGRRRPLTRRQAQMLGGYARGLTRDEVAVEMGCSTQNVTRLLVAARYALDAKTRDEAVAKAVGHGYVEAPPLPRYDTLGHRPRHNARTTARAKKQGLTERELEVLTLICHGFENEEIAAAGGVSVETVRSQVASLLGKLGARNRAQAATIAVSRKLVVAAPDREGAPIRSSRSDGKTPR